MEIPLNPDLESRLSRMAVQQGRATETLVQEAIERLVDHEEWFLQEVELGLAAAERGELVEDRDVRDLIDRRYSG
jgi:predicted transcriptional regulator